MGEVITSVARTLISASMGSVSCGQSRNLSLHPIVMLRVAGADGVTRSCNCPSRDDLDRSTGIVASCRRLERNACLTENPIQTKKQQGLRPGQHGRYKIFFSRLLVDALSSWTSLVHVTTAGDVMNSSSARVTVQADSVRSWVFRLSSAERMLRAA